MLLYRYSSIDHIFDMDAEDGSAMIIKALEKREEEKAWQIYLSKYPYMDESNFISFNEFYKTEKPQESELTIEEILDDVKNTLNLVSH